MRSFPFLILLIACSGGQTPEPLEPQDAQTPRVEAMPVRTPVTFQKTAVSGPTPTFTLAWSLYTSWSALASADTFGYLDNREGWQGEYERRFSVDVVLQRMDYVQSFGIYGSGTVDALLITNTDAYAVAGERKKAKGDATVAVFPTSWSDGADKILVEDEIGTWADLAGVPVHGAEFSVTQYLYWRGCALNGVADRYGRDFTFVNLDPVAGSTQFAGQQDPALRAFGAWSPETFTVLNTRNGDEDAGNDVRDLFNSSMLKAYEITDMLVVGQSALDRPGGVEAVKALAAAMQLMTDNTKDPAVQAETFRAISPNFNDLDNGAIGRSMELTHMMGPEDAAMLDSEAFRANMPLVTEFSIVHKFVASAEEIPMAWGTKVEQPQALLRFDTSIIR